MVSNIPEPTKAIKREARKLRIKLMKENSGLWMHDPELMILHMLCDGIQDRTEIENKVLSICKA
jgi:hypothetical protein